MKAYTSADPYARKKTFRYLSLLFLSPPSLSLFVLWLSSLLSLCVFLSTPFPRVLCWLFILVQIIQWCHLKTVRKYQHTCTCYMCICTTYLHFYPSSQMCICTMFLHFYSSSQMCICTTYLHFYPSSQMCICTTYSHFYPSSQMCICTMFLHFYPSCQMCICTMFLHFYPSSQLCTCTTFLHFYTSSQLCILVLYRRSLYATQTHAGFLWKCNSYGFLYNSWSILS